MIKMIRSKCHGRYSCVLSVSDGLADLSLDCSTNKKELSITHTCGKNTELYQLSSICPALVSCYPWQSYVDHDDCAASALLHNHWLSQHQVDNLGEIDLKAALIENLNKHIDGSTHSVPELSYRSGHLSEDHQVALGYRKQSDQQGGLCGMAAIYQALENTILTQSALARLDYRTMREIIEEELRLENSNLADTELLYEYHKCLSLGLLFKIFRFYFFLGFCHPLDSDFRKKRELLRQVLDNRTSRVRRKREELVTEVKLRIRKILQDKTWVGKNIIIHLLLKSLK